MKNGLMILTLSLLSACGAVPPEAAVDVEVTGACASHPLKGKWYNLVDDNDRFQLKGDCQMVAYQGIEDVPVNYTATLAHDIVTDSVGVHGAFEVTGTDGVVSPCTFTKVDGMVGNTYKIQIRLECASGRSDFELIGAK